MLSKMIAENTNKVELMEYAIEHTSYKPMVADGVKKALKGITSLDEVLRVTKD
jgi:general secretion pathway protein E/type IV pilus assembly protein PilB